jgi:hypothetical protein
VTLRAPWVTHARVDCSAKAYSSPIDPGVSRLLPRQVCVWDVMTGRRVQRLTNHQKTVMCVPGWSRLVSSRDSEGVKRIYHEVQDGT